MISKIWRVLVVIVCQYRYYKYLQFDEQQQQLILMRRGLTYLAMTNQIVHSFHNKIALCELIRTIMYVSLYRECTERSRSPPW